MRKILGSTALGGGRSLGQRGVDKREKTKPKKNRSVGKGVRGGERCGGLGCETVARMTESKREKVTEDCLQGQSGFKSSLYYRALACLPFAMPSKYRLASTWFLVEGGTSFCRRYPTLAPTPGCSCRTFHEITGAETWGKAGGGGWRCKVSSGFYRAGEHS